MERTAAPSWEYSAADETRSGLAVSRWIERHTDVEHLVQRRRSRYLQWVDAVTGLSGVQALFPQLPTGLAPYMFALRVDDPPALFYPLKQLGVPIWRWDDMAVSSCTVSARYRQGLFHLPCHQALDDAQMAWMTSSLRIVLRRGGPLAPARQWSS